MSAEKKETAVRCKACNTRFELGGDEKYVACPSCGQQWRMKWFKPGVGMIIAPASWTEYQRKSRKEAMEG